MLCIEAKLLQIKVPLQLLRHQVDQALAYVQPACFTGENLNVEALKLPLFVNAQRGCGWRWTCWPTTRISRAS
jgi:hypothetical protein